MNTELGILSSNKIMHPYTEQTRAKSQTIIFSMRE